LSFSFAFILPTTRCEVRCDFCYYQTGHSPRVEEADYLEPLDRALSALCDDGLQQVIISGGEPLLSPRLEPLARLCSDKLVHLLLLTRGKLLDEQTLEDLERWGVDDLTISAPEADDELRALVQRVLFRSRYTPNLLTALTRDRLEQAGPLLDLSGRFNLPHLFTPAFIPPEAGQFERLSLHGVEEREWLRLLDELGPWAVESGSATYLEMVHRFYNSWKVRPRFCPMGSRGLVIDADGSVYPCFHRRDLCAGNLLTHDWSDIAKRLEQQGQELEGAPCFGEYCLSMFAGICDADEEPPPPKD
jgi:radical SAM protein with 4Fe4S-binding SPASM domain